MLPGLVPPPLESRIIPHAGSVPTGLLLFDISQEKDFAVRCLAASVQGLYNSNPEHTDKIYLIYNDPDRSWAEYLLGHHYVQRQSQIKSLADLIKLAGTRRAIVSGSTPFHLNDVATTVASCERRLLVTDPKLLDRFHLRPILDLRGKFATNTEAYKWLWSHYDGLMNRKAASFTVPVVTATHSPSNLRDYLIANRIFTFWTSGPKEANQPGADSQSETAEIKQVLSKEIEPNTPVFGYPWSGDGFGPGEGDGVTLLSQTAHFLIPTDNFDNLSVWSCFAPAIAKAPSATAPLKYQSGHKYACLYMSDGDNMCTFQEFFPTYWRELGSKDFPVAWTMGPLLREVAPPMFDYARQNLPAGDTFGSGVSGVGYMAMDQYGLALESDQRMAATTDFLKLTAGETNKAGEDWLWVMRYGRPGGSGLSYGYSRPYAAILGGYGEVTAKSSESVEVAHGVPFFHNMLDASNPSAFEGKLGSFLAKPNCPDLFTVFICNWSFRPTELKAVAATLRKQGVTMVTAEQLGDLARQTHAVSQL